MDATPEPEPQPEPLAVEEVVPDLGSDPWLRFDMWAARAWNASQEAIKFAQELGPRANDSVDDRVIAMFHAAGIASEFAKMVNPNDEFAALRTAIQVSGETQSEGIIRLFTDNDE